MNYDVPHGKGMMVKSNGNARFGKWDKGIYQKPNTDKSHDKPEDDKKEDEEKGGQGGEIRGQEKINFPVFDLEGNPYTGEAKVEYSNGDIYQGFFKDGLRNGKVNFDK